MHCRNIAIKSMFAAPIQRGLAGLFSGHVLGPVGPGTFGAMFPFLPPPIRDHLQDSYWTALAP
jgi:hypothetical protein